MPFRCLGMWYLLGRRRNVATPQAMSYREAIPRAAKPILSFRSIQLGGTFNMPHADTHTVILPHATAYNAPYITSALAAIAQALGVESAPEELYDLARNNGAPYSLKALGFKEKDLEQAADIASKAPYTNPAPLVREELLKLLKAAYEGVRPGMTASV